MAADPVPTYAHGERALIVDRLDNGLEGWNVVGCAVRGEAAPPFEHLAQKMGITATCRTITVAATLATDARQRSRADQPLAGRDVVGRDPALTHLGASPAFDRLGDGGPAPLIFLLARHRETEDLVAAGRRGVGISDGIEPHRHCNRAKEVRDRVHHSPSMRRLTTPAGSALAPPPSSLEEGAITSLIAPFAFRSPQEQRYIEALLSLTTHPLDCVSLQAAKLLIGLWDVAPRVGWEGLRLALDLCIIPADEIDPNFSAGPAFAATSRSQKLQSALASLTQPARPLPIPPGPWQPIEEGSCRRRARESESDGWQVHDGWWESGTAGQLLEAVPVELATQDPVLGPLLLEHCEAMLRWTIERTAPAWNPEGRNLPDSTGPFEWVHSFGTVLGHLAGHLDPAQVASKFLDPISTLADEAAFALLTPLTISFMCEQVFDAPQMSANTLLVLNRSLDRLLAARELRRGTYRAGELHGGDAPRLAQWLMFVGVENANLAARFVNGDWSEVGTILPVVDRFVKTAGWAPTVMADFLTLVDRARDHYPADAFADALLAVLTSEPDSTPKWRGTRIPARIAARVQDLADREAPLPLALGQKLLRILDRLVDCGDRRSAALQISTAFRDLRL
jgi:hypothetical protein